MIELNQGAEYMEIRSLKQWKKVLEEQGHNEDYIKNFIEGFKDGQRKVQESVARKLLEEGYPVKKVAELTGLTQKKVRLLTEDTLHA